MFLIKRFDWTVLKGYYLIGQYIFKVLSRDIYGDRSSCLLVILRYSILLFVV